MHRLHQKIAELRQADGSGQPQIRLTIEHFQQQISELKAEWESPLNKAVSQHSMEQGEIEMF